ncbi:hypothetical protein Tco_0484684 [Tanacetum coccineum]
MESLLTNRWESQVVYEWHLSWKHLKLEDFDGISTLPTSEIFEQLALMGGQGENFTGLKRINNPQRVGVPSLTHQCSIHLTTTNFTTLYYDTYGIEGSLYHIIQESGDFGSNVFFKADRTDIYGALSLSYYEMLKMLGKKLKSSKIIEQRGVKLVVSEDEDELEDPSKQGRKIAQIDEDEGITLVQMSAQTQGRSVKKRSTREVRPVWNNAQGVHHQNKLTHPYPKRNFVPTVVATKSGLVPVNAAKQSSPRAAASISTARHVNTVALKQKVNAASPTKYS